MFKFFVKQILILKQQLLKFLKVYIHKTCTFKRQTQLPLKNTINLSVFINFIA